MVQRVQARMRDPEEVKRAGQGHGGGAAGGYSLVAGLKSCMQRDGVGLYRALGWRDTGESWEWNSDEHAALGQISVLTEKPRWEKRKESTAGHYRGDMPTKGAEGVAGQDDAQGTV